MKISRPYDVSNFDYMRQHQFVLNFVAGKDHFMNYGEVSLQTSSKSSFPIFLHSLSLFSFLTISGSSVEEASLTYQRETRVDKTYRRNSDFLLRNENICL